MDIAGLICRVAQLDQIDFNLMPLTERLLFVEYFMGKNRCTVVTSFYIYVHANKNQLVKKAIAIEQNDNHPSL